MIFAGQHYNLVYFIRRFSLSYCLLVISISYIDYAEIKI